MTYNVEFEQILADVGSRRLSKSCVELCDGSWLTLANNFKACSRSSNVASGNYKIVSVVAVAVGALQLNGCAECQSSIAIVKIVWETAKLLAAAAAAAAAAADAPLTSVLLSLLHPRCCSRCILWDRTRSLPTRHAQTKPPCAILETKWLSTIIKLCKARTIRILCNDARPSVAASSVVAAAPSVKKATTAFAALVAICCCVWHSIVWIFQRFSSQRPTWKSLWC